MQQAHRSIHRSLNILAITIQNSDHTAVSTTLPPPTALWARVAVAVSLRVKISQKKKNFIAHTRVVVVAI